MADKTKIEIKITDRTGEVLKDLPRRIEKAFTIVGNNCEEYAKRELNGDMGAPHRIDTGLLRNSVTWGIGGGPTAIGAYSGDQPSRYKNDGIIPRGSYSGNLPEEKNPTLYIGTNVEYALEVHEGTDRMEPNRFLRNAVENHLDEIHAWMKKALEEG